MCCVVIPYDMLNASEIVSEEEENNKVTDELLEVIGVSYENILSNDYEDTGDTYSCIIWTQDIDMTLAVKEGINAAEKTRPTYTSTMNLESAYSVMEVEGNTVIDVNFAVAWR